jgi:hypothetical protein
MENSDDRQDEGCWFDWHNSRKTPDFYWRKYCIGYSCNVLLLFFLALVHEQQG